MKNKTGIIFTLIATLLLTGCDFIPSRDRDRIISYNIVTLSSDGKGVEVTPGFPLFFKANSDIPYCSLTSMKDFLELFRTSSISKESYIKYEIKDDKGIFEDENNSSCVFDLTNQTITFSDFDGFNNYKGSLNHTLGILSVDKTTFVDGSNATYYKGEDYVVDLKGYTRLDIIKIDDELYIPFNLFNDLFVKVYTLTNLVYSFNNIFFLPDDAVFYTVNSLGKYEYTPIGKAYYDSKKRTPTVSQEYAEYNYQCVCFNYDHLYGVKGYKDRDYETFDDYLTKKGYKDDLLSGDVRKMDNALSYAISYLNDNHTATHYYSPLYSPETSTIDPSKISPYKYYEERDLETLQSLRKLTGASMGIVTDSKNRSIFLGFDTFDSIDVDLLSKHTFTDREILSSSPALFACAYDELTTKLHDSIDYVFVDMATNGGGSAEALLYILGVLIGEHTIETQNPFTGGWAKTTYKVDINRDGLFDENDKSLRELGFKIIFIDTHHSFSCGNALPVLAKENYPDEVTIIGETTGGGACILGTNYTPLGQANYMSSSLMLSKRGDNDDLVGIEYGVDPDIVLPEIQTIDRGRVLFEYFQHNNLFK